MVSKARVRTVVSALGLVGFAAFASGCVEQSGVQVQPARPAIQFAVGADVAASRGGIRVGAVRTVASQVNVAEPVVLAVEDGRINLTYARRGLEGASIALDPEALAPLASTPHTYPARAKGEPPANVATGRATVVLDSGRTMSVWIDEESGHVFAAIDGAPAVQVWGGDGIGAARAVTTDGQRVVVAFTTSTENGFDLVAMSLDAR